MVYKFKRPTIIDDGTLDTIVYYDGAFHRYNSELRFSFKNDEEFLIHAQEELANEKKLRYGNNLD